MFELPELPPCPIHGHDPSKPIGGCQICWGHFYIPWEYGPKLKQINFAIRDHIDRVETAKRLIALREEGFETDKEPPANVKVLFALPGGERVLGRYIDDMCGGTYPVRDDEHQTEVRTWSGWRYE